MILYSYAKLNLYLEILDKRSDNYHNIETVFERINLSDKILLKSRPDKKIKIICNNPQVPKDSSNLCFRSAKLLQDEFNLSYGADIEIRKNIPVGAGLGGGSSNAATVLLGLNKIWKLGLSRRKLLCYAQKIGADVAFFIYDTPFAVAKGRGDEIKPLASQRVKRIWQILIAPRFPVATPLVYKEWDRLKKNKKARLTKPVYNVKMLTLALKRGDTLLLKKCLFNSLEQATLKLFPQLKRVKEKLEKLGLEAILMSGSGPAVFGIVSSRKEAEAFSRSIQRQNRSWRVFAVRTM